MNFDRVFNLTPEEKGKVLEIYWNGGRGFCFVDLKMLFPCYKYKLKELIKVIKLSSKRKELLEDVKEYIKYKIGADAGLSVEKKELLFKNLQFLERYRL